METNGGSSRKTELKLRNCVVHPSNGVYGRVQADNQGNSIVYPAAFLPTQRHFSSFCLHPYLYGSIHAQWATGYAREI